jgi:hypothetical protein
MGFLGSIGDSFKRAYNKVRDWAKPAINSIGSALKPIVSGAGKGLGWIGSSIKDGREWLRKIPVLGSIGNKIADITGVNGKIDSGIGAIDSSSNMLNQLSEGKFKDAWNSGLDAVRNGASSYTGIKMPSKMPTVQDMLWPKKGENSSGPLDVWDKYKLNDTIPKLSTRPRIGMPPSQKDSSYFRPIGNKGHDPRIGIPSQYPIGTQPQLRSGSYQTGGGLKK